MECLILCEVLNQFYTHSMLLYMCPFIKDQKNSMLGCTQIVNQNGVGNIKCIYLGTAFICYKIYIKEIKYCFVFMFYMLSWRSRSVFCVKRALEVPSCDWTCSLLTNILVVEVKLALKRPGHKYRLLKQILCLYLRNQHLKNI